MAFLVCVFSTYAVSAQFDAISNLSLQKNPKYQWANESKKASIKESKMQVNFYLNQKDAENYIYIVDDQVLPVNDFKEYKESILKQARAINFVKRIDSVMGNPSHRNRMLILITTQTVED
ncbi:MAG TPA: hypothetical protein DIV44_13645 [Leeuwenhoekiella sp.]|nr:hypothetical protein [Leeuwenhoekiella sp.]HBO29030.1 hypothetical protein [Leeuwenhoekiella sp.]HCQ77848.1 hypothetical protein [Leeuwenhoekiella sp.]